METDTRSESPMVLEGEHLSAEASSLMIEALRWGKMSHVPENLLTHVEACRECKDNIMEVMTFLRNPNANAEKTNKGAAKYNRRRDWYFLRGRIAAAIAVMALLASAYFFIFKDQAFSPNFLTKSASASKQEAKMQTKAIAPTPKEEPGKLSPLKGISQESDHSNGIKAVAHKTRKRPSLDSRYHVNPNLENMIGSHLRSGLFEVNGPENDSRLTAPIQFSWKKNLVHSHTLKIVNNKNDVVYSFPVLGNSFTFRENLVPGLYYWKLESPNELLFVGKFFIGNSSATLAETQHR